MGVSVNIEEMRDYVEPKIPALDYYVRIDSGSEKVAKSGRIMFNFQMEIMGIITKDGVVDDEMVDTDQFIKPIGSKIFGTLMFVMPQDPPKTVNFFQGKLASYIQNFMPQPEGDELEASDFVGLEGGVRVKYDKDDRVEITKAIPLPAEV